MEQTLQGFCRVYYLSSRVLQRLIFDEQTLSRVCKGRLDLSRVYEQGKAGKSREKQRLQGFSFGCGFCPSLRQQV